VIFAANLAAGMSLAAEAHRHVEVLPVAAREAGVATLDGVMKAFYEVISGSAGKPRQWSRDRSLYVPGVKFVMLDEKKEKVFSEVVDHQAYVDQVNDVFVQKGFFEREIHRSLRRFGNLAQVLSTYESREREDGPVLERGVNALNLYWDGKRWWIASVVRDEERANNPIPADLLAGESH
jgi:hypothetical protein